MHDRTALFSQMLLCAIIQSLELFIIAVQVFTEKWPRIITLETSSLSLFLRIFLALMLHFSLIDEVRGAQLHMKFAMNHEYLFYSSNIASTAALFKFWSALLTEFLNIFFLMSTFSPLSLIQNFISLQVVASFPDMMAGSI